jgi:ferredoxin
MTKVTVQPANIEFDVPVGETLMGAARAQGFYWPTTCGGGDGILQRPIRLACQAVVCGDEPIVLTKAGVRTPDL